VETNQALRLAFFPNFPSVSFYLALLEAKIMLRDTGNLLKAWQRNSGLQVGK